MKRIKVLLVDDSAVIRKVLGDLLASDPEIEVVGTASNGKIAVEQVQALQPDVVTMDIEMPEMNGLEAVQKIRQGKHQVPIIMCSSLTADGASHTLEALALGASDYVTKPSSHGVNTRDVVGDELIRKIKGLFGAQQAHSAEVHVRSYAQPPERLQCNSEVRNREVIAIGVSTGGPNALADLLPRLPANLQTPVLIVQHMPPVFTTLLAERLNGISPIPVVEAQHAQEVRPGTIYLAPGGLHMEVKRLLGRVLIGLHEGPPENSCRPAVDVLFRSVAKVYATSALGIVLTGMGQDGLKGAELIAKAGGELIVQDRASCAVWGMPGAIVEAGLSPLVLPLAQIAQEISGFANNNPRGFASVQPRP
ncbi:MAG: chemotaxis response regulator protein-glutamate methylesterase [Pseudomonadota bacterium]|jgi:two-component system chemotaxis response regulator CheB